MRTRRAGFTLVEVIVAILVLTVGLLGQVGATAAILRGVADAARRLGADSAARQRIEWLAAQRCAALADGSGRDGVLAERWSVRVDTVSETADVREEVTYRAAGWRSRSLVYATGVSC